MKVSIGLEVDSGDSSPSLAHQADKVQPIVSYPHDFNTLIETPFMKTLKKAV